MNVLGSLTDHILLNLHEKKNHVGLLLVGFNT